MTLAPPHSEPEARPRGLGYGARLASMWLRLAATPEAPLTVLTRDQLAERSADGTNAFENMLKTGYAWVRADFTGGEGLDRYPRTPPGPTDDTRYFASNNLELRRPEAGRPYAITLAQRIDPWFAEDPITEVRATVDRLYVAMGTNIVSFGDDGDPSPDDLFSFPAAVFSFDVSDADEGIALLVNGQLWHKPVGVVSWNLVTPNVSGILDNLEAVWLCKGRVIVWRNDTASAGPSELVEISLGLGGTPALPTYTLTEVVIDTFQAEVITVEDAGMCVLAITNDRQIRSYVPRQDSTADPIVLTLESTSPMPKGEQPIAVAYNSGKLLILSTHQDVMRAYSAAMLDERFNFIVGDLTMVRQWESVVTDYARMVRQVVAARDEFLWLVSTIDGATDLWRYDLVTTGVHRHQEASPTDDLDGIVVWNDRQYVFQRGGVQLSRTSAFYVDEGWLITPLINFNLNADINWTELTIQAFDLSAVAGVQVQVAISNQDDALLDHNHPSWRVVAQLTSPTVDAIEVPMASEIAPKLALRLTLRAHVGANGTPRVTQLGVRGIPGAQEVVVSLPVAISDQVEAPGRRPFTVPGLGDSLFASLMALRGRATEVQVVAPPLLLRGVVTQVGTPVTYLTERGSVGRYAMVEILGDTVAEGESESGLGGFSLGVGLIGVSLIGVSE